MESKNVDGVGASTKRRQYSARESERIDNLIRMLNVAKCKVKKRDLAKDYIADPQASRTDTVRGESPCIPLNNHRQALCNAAEPLRVMETAALVLLGELGVDDWVNRN